MRPGSPPRRRRRQGRRAGGPGDVREIPGGPAGRLGLEAAHLIFALRPGGDAEPAGAFLTIPPGLLGTHPLAAHWRRPGRDRRARRRGRGGPRTAGRRARTRQGGRPRCGARRRRRAAPGRAGCLPEPLGRPVQLAAADGLGGRRDQVGRRPGDVGPAPPPGGPDKTRATTERPVAITG